VADGSNFEHLKAAILELSQSTEWDTARLEWRLVSVHQSDDPQTCPCTHYPILEICTLDNRLTGHSLEVGNVCVKRFIGIQTQQIFDGLRRVGKFNNLSLNAACIVFFRERGVLTDWEYEFLSDTFRRRTLTGKQLAQRQQINRRILALVRRRGIAAR
jgi:hypothetical protein